MGNSLIFIRMKAWASSCTCVHLAVFWKKQKRWQISLKFPDSDVSNQAQFVSLLLGCWKNKNIFNIVFSNSSPCCIAIDTNELMRISFIIYIHLISTGTKVCTNIIAQLSAHFDLVVSFSSNNSSPSLWRGNTFPYMLISVRAPGICILL